MPSLLLIEFAVTESFHRAVEFPFLYGLARDRGVPARWVRFGVSAAAEFHGEGSGVPLSAEDAAAAARHMDEVDADRVVFSHKPAEALVAALNRSRDDVLYRYAEFASKGEEGAAILDGVAVERLRGDLGTFLGVGSVRTGASLLEAAPPDFGFVPGNDAAREAEVLPFLLIGEECTWNRSFASNPFYEGLDLSACFRDGGCAFCARPDNSRQWTTDPADLLDRQLRAVAATCPTFGRRLRIRLVGEPVIRHIREVAARVLEAGLPAADLLLDSRADTLVEVADALRGALDDLGDSGHCLHLCLIGIESFSSRELGRMNKGLRAEQNIAAVQTLFVLEAEYPGRFAFRQYGGLSLITYTPWTKPEELDLNLAVLELLDLAPFAGKHLTGRLRLYPGLPLEARARADGLVRSRYDDSLLDTARLTFYENEIPWAFREPVMEPINRLLVRLEHEGEAGDPLTAAVRALDREARAASMPRTTLAHRLVGEALREAWSGAEVTPDALLDATRSMVPAAGEAAPTLEQWTTHGPPNVEDMGGEALPFERILDMKPVSKIEPLRREDVDLWVVDPAIPNASSRRRGGESSGSTDVWEVFFGRDPDDVARAIHLTEIMDRQPSEAQERDAIGEVGELLGYPQCCAQAYAAEPADIRTSYFWLHVDRRLAATEEVPWELHPVPGKIIEYVPCSLACAPSLTRARTNLDAMPWTGGATREAFEAVCRNPHLLLWDVQSSAVELIPDGDPGERFRFQVGRTWGEGVDIGRLAEGDELIIEDEAVLVLRRGRPWISLSGRAFLWWHRKVFQADFWRAMLDFRRAVPRQAEGHAVAATANREPASPTMAVLDRLLLLFRKNNLDFAGASLAEWTHRKDGRAALRLEGDGEVRLMVEVATDDTQALWQVGPYALSYPSDSPLSTRRQWAIAEAFRDKLFVALKKIVKQQSGSV